MHSTRFKASFPTPRDAVAYIMDTFPIVKRKDEEKWSEYRTKSGKSPLSHKTAGSRVGCVELTMTHRPLLGHLRMDG